MIIARTSRTLASIKKPSDARLGGSKVCNGAVAAGRSRRQTAWRYMGSDKRAVQRGTSFFPSTMQLLTLLTARQSVKIIEDNLGKAYVRMMNVRALVSPLDRVFGLQYQEGRGSEEVLPDFSKQAAEADVTTSLSPP